MRLAMLNGIEAMPEFITVLRRLVSVGHLFTVRLMSVCVLFPCGGTVNESDLLVLNTQWYF